MDAIAKDLGTLFRVGTIRGLSDGQLLGRFVERHEADAFEAIIQRHGPMVWGVCQRILRNRHDSEDAFQATFLVLARKAASVSPREKLGNWLYGVANQTARKARSMREKRRIREGQVPDPPEPTAKFDDARNILSEALDRELGCLSEKYRTAVVLCELEGLTHRDAARQLGLPVGTISSRLARAKAMLAKRLTRPGMTLTVGSLGAFLAQASASAGISPKLNESTAQAASLIAARRAVSAGIVSAEVAALTREVMKTMLLSKIKVVMGVLLATALVGAGIPNSSTEEQKSSARPAQQAVPPDGEGRQTVQAAAPQAGGHRITVTSIIADPSTLPVGAECQVALEAETKGEKKVVELIYHGKISKATAEGLALTVSSVRRKESHPSKLSQLPVVSRLFTNVGIGQVKPGEEKVVWLPAEKIRSVTLAGNSTL
ncbi:RNA polymerase sigma factor [Singulisphaera rosea]